MSKSDVGSTPPMYDMAIIGAGLAGSLCAHLLSEPDISLCIIDKSRGSGGRASSKRLDDGTSCDLGAPFIHAKQEETRNLLETLTKQQVTAHWPQLNTNEAQAFVGTPKMSAITRHWIADTDFITNTRVHHLEHHADDHDEQGYWLIRDDKYQPVVRAKKIIIAAPAPQAAAILSTNERLAVLLLRANQACAHYQSQWAMWLETDTCDLSAIIELKDSPIKRMIKDNHKPMRHSDNHDRWVIQANPAWSKQHLDANKEWIAQALLQAFSEETEHRVLKHGEPHRWFLSRFAENRGNNDFAWAPEHNIGLAGDWLCQGDAEGALLSAIALTNRIKGHDL
ncbi:NAD(P)/FAD-dependent oxidoreductase [Marinomonas sp. IMCC 4694]|uniref:NAD(P)/FAD-dependent oxidoreductase n=1 Tax=Marinomonas sp. IMCC 4694 TaxID=2605432 RepID=UPI0011E78B15|nr:NAD(P)-binding protein [Marinomonas sp. IMCC 4694]TYL48530.1 NAD(P)-binding protein [Marinomonas sp. IMCC 4694]